MFRMVVLTRAASSSITNSKPSPLTNTTLPGMLAKTPSIFSNKRCDRSLLVVQACI